MAFGYNIDQRKINKRNHVIDLFRQNSTLSKATARTLSGYSMDTVISIFNNLIEEEIIIPSEGKQKAKGRKATFYSLNDDKWYYLGITFNQSGIFSTIMSFSHISKERNVTRLNLGISKEDFVAAFLDHIEEIINKDSAYAGTIVSIGCSIPGDIDLKSGILHSYVFMPFLKELNFKEILQKKYPKIDIRIDHNIHSMTSYLLRDRELIENNNNILYVSARSGAANGYIFNGSIVTGHGEFGHIKVSDEDIECLCGRKGCLDCYFSYPRFLEILTDHTGEKTPMAESDDENAGIEKLALLYKEGIPEIVDTLNNRLHYFTIALVNAINLSAPDMIILSGQLFKVFGDPVKAIHGIIMEHYQSSGFVTLYENTNIIYREMGAEISSLGICYEMIREDWDYIIE